MGKQLTQPPVSRVYISQYEHMLKTREHWGRAIDAWMLAIWFASALAILSAVFHWIGLIYLGLALAGIASVYIVTSLVVWQWRKIFGRAKPPKQDWQLTEDAARRLASTEVHRNPSPR